MSYEHETKRIRSFDGTEIFLQCWLSDRDQPERSLLIHHGLGEHSGRYTHVIDHLKGSGINLFALDARGHGRSGGTKGDVTEMRSFVLDLETVLGFLSSEYQVERPILLGHSMGALISIFFCLSYSNQWHVRALVTSGAALRPHLNAAQQVKKRLGQLISKVRPDLVMPSGLPTDGISHDPRIIEEYERDPFVHDRISVRMGLALLEAGEDCLARAQILKVPVLITHGQSDPIADARASMEFFEKCGSSDRDLIIYPGLLHEIYNESADEREKVLSDLRRWLEQRLPERKSQPVVTNASEHSHEKEARPVT